MPGATVVRTLLFAAWALTTAAEQPAAPAPSTSSVNAWRAVAIDGSTKKLLVIEPGLSEPSTVGHAVPGYTFESRDPSRLVIFAQGPDSTTATVLTTSPLSILGPIRTNAKCGVPGTDSPIADRLFRQRIVESRDGTRLSLICGDTLTTFDLQSGAALTQLVPTPGSVHALGDERIAVIDRRMRVERRDVLVFDARTLTSVARLRLDDQAAADVALVSGGREVLVFAGAMNARGGSQPSRLRYFDAASGAPTRAVSLEGPFRATRFSADGRFVYATNMDRQVPRQSPRELRILSAETGELLETVALMEHAAWLDAEVGPVQIIEDRRYREPASSRVVFLDGGRVTATMPTYNFVYQLSVDHERGRLYLLDGRSLTESTWPALRLQRQVAVGTILGWGGQPEDRPSFALAPGADRALVVSGASAVVVDLAAGKALPAAKLGSAGARARRFWGGVGRIALAMISRSAAGPQAPALVAGGDSDPVGVAFSRDGRMAMLTAPTGELAMIDLGTGQCIRNVRGGDAALAIRGASIAVAADEQSSWIVSAESGDVVARFPVPTALADARVFTSISADRRLVLVARGSTAHLVDAKSGQVLSNWDGFERIEWLRFLPGLVASAMSAR